MQEKPEPRGFAPALPYFIPYAAFAALTFLSPYAEGWQAELYALKVVVVAALLWYYRKAYTELRARLNLGLLPAVLVGVGVIVVWVGLDPYYPQTSTQWQALWQEGFQRFNDPERLAGGFNPYHAAALMPPLVAIIVRVTGAVALVPVFEELFWRSWLIRWLVKDDFRSVPIGTFTFLSFAVTVIGFGITHNEWLAAVICGAAFNGLLYWKRDIFHCVVAHAVANAALAAWVLTQGAWHFW